MMTTLANLARNNIASFVPERAYGRLKKSFRFIVNRDRLLIFSLYYWARWANDGRGPVQAKPGGWLFFFEDPRDDPRIKGDYPTKPGKVKRLTRRQLEKAREEETIIAVESVGSAPGIHFLEDGIRKTRAEAPAKLVDLVRGDVRRLLRRGRNKITVRL
jgi:hypothetical protein